MRGKGSIEPPRHLGLKAVKGRGPNLDTILERSEHAIQALKRDYTESMKQDLLSLVSALEPLVAGTQENKAAALGNIYRISHDLRGLAGTFDYPLIARLATSLCDFVDQSSVECPLYVDVISTHVGAMRAVLSAKATGDGGATGERLLQGVSGLVAQATSASP